MLKVLIKGTLHIKCEKVKVLNPNINFQNVSDKDMVLDVKMETESREVIDIECNLLAKSYVQLALIDVIVKQ